MENEPVCITYGTIRDYAITLPDGFSWLHFGWFRVPKFKPFFTLESSFTHAFPTGCVAWRNALLNIYVSLFYKISRYHRGTVSVTQLFIYLSCVLKVFLCPLTFPRRLKLIAWASSCVTQHTQQRSRFQYKEGLNFGKRSQPKWSQLKSSKALH